MISSIELTVLGLINFKPMHGYKLCNFFEEKGIYDMMEIKKPSVYAILKRYEKQGLISGEYEFDENNPPKKVYSITKDGLHFLREHLRDYLLNYSSMNPAGFWHLLRFCRNNVSQKDFLEIINRMKKLYSEHVKHMQEKRQHLKLKQTKEQSRFFSVMEELIGALRKASHKALNDFISFAENPENEPYFLKKEELKE